MAMVAAFDRWCAPPIQAIERALVTTLWKVRSAPKWHYAGAQAPPRSRMPGQRPRDLAGYRVTRLVTHRFYLGPAIQVDRGSVPESHREVRGIAGAAQ